MKNANIRIGDKVKIRNDLKGYYRMNRFGGGEYIPDEMVQCAGQTLEVMDIDRPSYLKCDWGYKLNDNSEKFIWSEDLFEEVVEYNERYSEKDCNITFPCWPGETLYVISGNSIREFCTTSFEITDKVGTNHGTGEILIRGYDKETYRQHLIDFQPKDMGKTIFFRKEAAIHYLISQGVEFKRKLIEYNTGDTVRIGNRDYIVLEHTEDGNTIIRTKKFYLENVVFDEETSNYKFSSVRKGLQPLFDELKAIVGEENIIKHTVDLTTEDGRKDFGNCEDYISLPTSDFTQKHIDIFNKYKECTYGFEWLANAWSVPENQKYKVCALYKDCLRYQNCYNVGGACALCVLKSDTAIF